ERGVRHEVSAIGRKITRVSSRHQRTRNKLRRPAAWHKIREDFIITGLRQRQLDGPSTVGLFLGMDMLEVIHILTDHEEVILPFVDHFKLVDSLTVSRMKNSEQQLRLLAWLHNGGRSLKVETVISNIERRCANKLHAAAWTLPGEIHRIVRMHRANPSSVLF